MKKTVAVSVLIPTLNRPESLKRTLEKYMLSDCIPAQVVVVDQSQKQEFRDEVERIVQSFSSITEMNYVYQETPSSTRSRNKALDLAKEDIVIFSDDDIDVEADTLSNVMEIFEQSTVALVAGLDKNLDVSGKMSKNIGYILGTKSFAQRKIGHVTSSVLGRYPDKKIVEETQTKWAMGFFFAVRKSLLQKWEIRWDEKMTGYAYAEDLDFTYRYNVFALSEGYKCILSPKVVVNHLVSREYRVPSTITTYKYVINRWYISYKHCMGIHSRLAILWCDFWKFIARVLRKENPRDIFMATCAAIRYRKDIRQGILDFEKYLD